MNSISPKQRKIAEIGEDKVVLTDDATISESILEKLYQRYSIKQRRAGLECFLTASVLFDFWAIFVPQGQSWESLAITCACLVLNVVLIILTRIFGQNTSHSTVYEIIPHTAWLVAMIQLFLQIFFKGAVTPRDSLGWAILLNFLVYVTLPIPLKYAIILLGFGTFVLHLNASILLPKHEEFFVEQNGANAVLLATSALVGLLCYFLGEAKHRRAFLEAKQSLEVKMVIEEQSAEQERLLLSVLPEHVAVKMRQDLGSNDSEQFKKIYMSRHENVSILYADIVGFTAISSTYSAQDLVKMLNELFARFDRLAEKYFQLRIKILGDCYYCISGAPVERPDHAALCVYMGLSMVKAIKYVQQKTNSPVDMRVGIHTGAILAGILGQRQWQFDVYSKDVELANKMESSGLAGRVHISEKTLSFLSGEFEVESAFGEKREEALRIAGLKTYFIKKVLKPFISVPAHNSNDDSAAYKNGSTIIETTDPAESIDGGDCPSITSKDDDSKTHSIENQEHATIIDEPSDKELDFKERLKEELLSRDRHGELSKDTDILLRFKNNDLEKLYAKHREPLSSIPLLASAFVFFVGAIYSSIILPSSICRFFIILSPILLIVWLVFISIAESFPGILPDCLTKSSKRFNDVVWIRRLAAIIIVLTVGITNVFDMMACVCSTKTESNFKGNQSTFNVNNLTLSSSSPSLSSSSSFAASRQNVKIFSSTICLYFPSYYSNYAVLILIATALIAQLSHICKLSLMIAITALHCYMNIFRMDEIFRAEDYHTWNAHLPICYSLSALLIAVTIALGYLARHIDKEDRVIFKWKTEVNEQKEKASDMRRRNEALVYNILPIHVAEHFMRNKSRSYDELYSQSYNEVGVLFASMPNFSDFYSEDTVNNQGLECLRFLNEVISDFDALLEVPKFQDVIKIKTIGSTYMAASGLNPSRQFKPDDPIIVRWEQLALLVDFALELKKALQCINEQSFNHFVLKMGINHGPITAGVIGARKPHYDIWGNTVNVASRMESTGKAGAIQVTEETCEILQTFGYTFEQRGLVAVKGKGQLMTYYLQGKTIRQNSIHSSPILASINPMETVPEVDESKETTPLNGVTPADSSNVVQQINNTTTATSISSSSASPNSVKLNQSHHIDTQNIKLELIQKSSNSMLSTEIDKINNSNNLDDCQMSSAAEDADHKSNGLNNVDFEARKPLLDAKNSTNLHTINDFSNDSEKEALIINSKK